MLVLYGVFGRPLNAIKSMYADSIACMGVNGEEGIWFKTYRL